MRPLALLLAAALIAGPAGAQPKPRPVGPPANLRDATVQAWLKAHVDASGFIYALTDDAGVYYLRPALNQLPAPDRRRIWLRRVRFAANANGTREDMSLYEFDCAQGRRRMLAIDAYGGLNFAEPPQQSGDYDTDRGGDAPWSYPRADTVDEALLVQACALKTGPWAAKAPAP